jgi:hypothetical protein
LIDPAVMIVSGYRVADAYVVVVIVVVGYGKTNNSFSCFWRSVSSGSCSDKT